MHLFHVSYQVDELKLTRLVEHVLFDKLDADCERAKLDYAPIVPVWPTFELFVIID